MLQKLREFDISKATGLDNIPAGFLKDAAGIISPCVAHIVNKSIKTETFPRDLKLARVIHLFEKRDKLEQGNYRPCFYF